MPRNVKKDVETKHIPKKLTALEKKNKEIARLAADMRHIFFNFKTCNSAVVQYNALEARWKILTNYDPNT